MSTQRAQHEDQTEEHVPADCAAETPTETLKEDINPIVTSNISASENCSTIYIRSTQLEATDTVMTVAESVKLLSTLNEVLLYPVIEEHVVELVPTNRSAVTPAGTLAARTNPNATSLRAT